MDRKFKGLENATIGDLARQGKRPYGVSGDAS
jgi:hypothetical protein